MAKIQSKIETIIADKLIKDGSATVAELMACASVSRPTAIKALKPFLDSGALIKRGVRYGFFGGCAAVFLKVNRSGGEIAGYSLGEGELTRIAFEFSEMLSYTDNLGLYAKKAEGYMDFLRKNYRKVFCSLIYDCEHISSLCLPNLFDVSICCDDLFAGAFLRDHGDKLCVLLDTQTNEATIFDRGRVVRKINVEEGRYSSVIENIFEILSPDTLIIYGNIDDESAQILERLCHRRGVALAVSEASRSLPIDEREALVRLICSVK